ncbi:MAG: type II toxin-antitoxin system VapC family toxin [Candidatus Sulfotelmatobacter sp.]|jgi:predicted nucleic acid-binding protein
MARRAGRPLAQTFAFWDASALIPLCVRQGITLSVVSLYGSYQAVVWWATPVEIASALARLVRTGAINSSDCAKARQVAVVLADEWLVIQPSDSLRARATQLVDRYDLRAADSLQLAAALDWCEDAPQGQVFLAADQRLREAAVLSGFEAKAI